MTPPSSALTTLGRRHGGMLFELVVLFLFYGVARYWFHPASLLQLAPALGLIVVWNGSVRAAPGRASFGEIVRPLAIAGIGVGAAFFFAGSVRAVAGILGAWCLLVIARPLVAGVRALRTVQWPRPTFKVGSWQRGRAPVLNFLLPILLAWAVTGVVHRQIYGSDVRQPERNTYGPVRLRIKLAGTSAGIPEPLVVCGRAGNASSVFIRLLKDNRAKVGVEFWDLELSQGEEFTLPAADAELELVCSVPAFFPEEGSAAWHKVPPAVQRQRLGEYRVTVDGVVRLQGFVNYHQPPRSGLYFGENPLGGTFISKEFSGTILRFSQDN